MKRIWLKTAGLMLAVTLACVLQSEGAYAAAAGGAGSDPAYTAGIKDSDTVDPSRRCSVSIYKYDITGAGSDGTYSEGEFEATGEPVAELESIMADYAVEGVGFTCVRAGDAETYSAGGGSVTELVYEVPFRLGEILGLSESDGVDMNEADPAFRCGHTGVSHYTGLQINDALAKLMSENRISAKNDLEYYAVHSPQKIVMDLTDGNGYTGLEDMDQGLYLIVETSVPEQITDTTDPWFVSLPFTDSAGNGWLYDITCYPKNQSGSPSLEKFVRNMHGGSSGRAGEYEKHATASGGEILDYILVSELPHIQSSATSLTEYTFTDTLSPGLIYNHDVRIAFYEKAEDAGVNDTDRAALIWDEEALASGYADIVYEAGQPGEGTTLTVALTGEGLDVINKNYSDWYIVVYYSVTAGSDANVITGDAGNPNNVRLTWRRTSEDYSDFLEDECVVYTYALSVHKVFSDERGDPLNVCFVLCNTSDGYYVNARPDDNEKGLYYVTGAGASKDEATVFSPDEEGDLYICGVEGAVYELTETATDRGYSILSRPVTIGIYSGEDPFMPGSASATVDGAPADMGGTPESGNSLVSIEIVNNPSFLLPKTGEEGGYILSAAGLILSGMGIIILLRKRRTPGRINEDSAGSCGN